MLSVVRASARRGARSPRTKSQAAPLGGFEPPAFGLEGLSALSAVLNKKIPGRRERQGASYPLSLRASLEGSQFDGLMFWFMRKKFVGSYRSFRATSRS